MATRGVSTYTTKFEVVRTQTSHGQLLFSHRMRLLVLGATLILSQMLVAQPSLSGTSVRQVQPTPEELTYIQKASQTYVIGTLVSGDIATATIRLNGETRHVPLQQGVLGAYGISKGRLAFTSRSGAAQEEFSIVDVAGGKPAAVLTADRILGASWRPGHAAIAVAYQQAAATQVAVYDIEAQSLRQVESFQSDRPFLFWSRDGETLNYVTSGSGIAKAQSYDAQLNARTLASVKPESGTAQSAKPMVTGPVGSYTFLYTDGSTDPTDYRTPLILIHGIEGGTVSWQNGVQTATTDTWDKFLEYYNQSCDPLTNQGCDLQNTYRIYEFIYQSDLYSVYDLAGSLRNQIDAAVSAHLMPDGPVVLLAHSMGGLIARSYMSQYQTNQGASNYNGQLAGERVLKLITLGTPHHGTPIANGPSRDTLLTNADAFVQFLPDAAWIDVAHLMENAGTIVGLTTAYNVPNRDDLWWDNSDNAMSGTNGDTQPFTIDLLNSDTTYDGKISAFYGYYDSTLDSDYEAARENVYGWPPSAQRLPYISNQTLSIGVIMANGLEDVSGNNLYPRSDGFVPDVSAFFQGHTVAEIVECPGYNHNELHDGRADYLPCNATGTFNSKNVLDAIHDRLTAIRPFAVDTPASMVSPASGTILSESSVTFQWNLGSGVAEVQLGVGTSPGQTDIFTAWEGIHTSQTVSGLPTNGQPVYVTLQSKIQGQWQSASYAYTASGATGLYALTISATGSGTVTSGDGYINCGTSCAHVYSSGTSVILNAIPAPGWTFSNWGGACSGIDSCNVTMTATTAVTANFTTSGSTAYTLTVNSSNPSSGVGITVSPSDINGYGDGPSSFTRTYNQNAQVTLTAQATASGNNFSSWTGCDQGAGNLCTVTMTTSRAVTANYTTPDAASVYSYSVLYSFSSDLYSADGRYPQAGLIQDAAGNLYGTAQDGGAFGSGTVFKIDTSGKETVLYNFCSAANCVDGSYPNAVIQDAAGNLYGTTIQGGSYGRGSVFKVDSTGHETVLYSFCSVSVSSIGGLTCLDGWGPTAGLIQDATGNLYGTTQEGGAGGGTVFKIDTSGNETVLYNFCSAANCTDGLHPVASLIQDAAGSLYGTTAGGGASGSDGEGTVFKIDISGHETVLYSFCSVGGSACLDGAGSDAGLIQDAAGNLYGTTIQGGSYGRGTVFKVDNSGIETVLYNFCSVANCPDGASPHAGLIEDAAGNLYGTTEVGGVNSAGTVFKVDTMGKETVLYSFCSIATCLDGQAPVAGLIQDAAGNLYGSTWSGGLGVGAVFKLTPGTLMPQTISFPTPVNQTYGENPVTLTASATSGLPVDYPIPPVLRR